jgi:hypothetical protein
MLRAHPGQKLFCFALACILGGAVGNVVDRLMHGYVVDFLDFHWAGWHFPAFNMADAAITVGAACLILDELLRVRALSAAAPTPTPCGRDQCCPAVSWGGVRGYSCTLLSMKHLLNLLGCRGPARLGHPPGAHRHPARVWRQPAPADGAQRQHRFTAVLSGIGVTALVQSSTATALIVSSFVGQGLVGLRPRWP